jgi:integrase
LGVLGNRRRASALSTSASFWTRSIRATLAYTCSRIGAAVNLKVEDYFQSGTQSFLRFRTKGGKEKEMPAHHKLAEILDAYLNVSGLRTNPSGTLFPTTVSQSRKLGTRPMTRIDGANLLKRRLKKIGMVGEYSLFPRNWYHSIS